MIHRIRTIDAHAAGEPLRLIIEGFPHVEGATMLEKEIGCGSITTTCVAR